MTELHHACVYTVPLESLCSPLVKLLLQGATQLSPFFFEAFIGPCKETDIHLVCSRSACLYFLVALWN